MAVDAKRYLRLTPFGVTDILKTEGGFSLRFKRFEPETGAELEQPELQEFVIDDLHKKVDELNAELEGLNQIIKKCDEL